MIILVAFAFLAGVVTILSPCILPILPIVLSGSLGGGKARPLGVVAGFIASFTFFTLFLSSLVSLLGIPADALRSFSIIVIFLFGLSLLSSQVQAWIEKAFAKLANLAPRADNKNGFWGGCIIGLSLGLVWTPCVGPILASVISLALTGEVNFQAFVITLAYAIGTAIPMLMIVWGGRRLLQSNQWLVKNSGKIQKAFGVLMLLTALAIFFNIDRKFQTFILDKFPQYGVGLTQIEDNASVRQQLGNLGTEPVDASDMGKPMDALLKDFGSAPELIQGGLWFNSEPLTLESLRGKVVMVDFWTYTCINCIRTLPYLRSWHDKYSDNGLVIIGVHTPEFEFEKEPGNVEKAIADFDLTYPVMQDNSYSTWRAYKNRYWPAKYLIDKNGRIRYTHFGEGEYDETERVIQALLAEAGSEVNDQIANPQYEVSSRTPELYLGSARYVSGYTAFSGEWDQEEEFSRSFPGSTLTLKFNAKAVFLVARPIDGSSEIVTILDGAEMSESIVIDANKIYHLVDLESPGQHTLEIQFPEGRVEVYAFTFG